MKCPKCGNKVLETDDFCSSCKMNLSFTTKTKNSYKEVEETINTIGEKTNNLKGKIIVIVAITVIILMAIINFFNIFTLFKFFALIKKYSTSIIVLGVLLLIIWLILFFTKKKQKILGVLFTISLILIIVPSVLNSMLKIDGDVSSFLKDYSKVNYIELGTEKIPTIYSVVGYREIITNIEEKDEYDEGMKTKIDFISIIYKNLSNDDIEKYKSKILEIGYEKKSIIDDDGEEVVLFVKDKSDNTFYVVSIVDSNITYSKGNGSFNNILNNNK